MTHVPSGDPGHLEARVLLLHVLEHRLFLDVPQRQRPCHVPAATKTPLLSTLQFPFTKPNKTGTFVNHNVKFLHAVGLVAFLQTACREIPQ